jgi:hypothetical protein
MSPVSGDKKSERTIRTEKRVDITAWLTPNSVANGLRKMPKL